MAKDKDLYQLANELILEISEHRKFSKKLSWMGDKEPFDYSAIEKGIILMRDRVAEYQYSQKQKEGKSENKEG